MPNESAINFIKGAIGIEDSIKQHVNWVFDNIYDNSHAEKSDNKNSILDVARLAMYIPIFANLYRKYGDKDAMTLSDDDIKLLQIAALFQDSRSNEEKNTSQLENVTMLYKYLTIVLGIPKVKAKLITEAATNNDAQKNQYFEITENDNGEIKWSSVEKPFAKNIYQKLLNDADRLDSIKSSDVLDCKLLDFYQDHVVNNLSALDDLSLVVCEARSLINLQGDGMNRKNLAVKARYENNDCFAICVADLQDRNEKPSYKLLKSLFADGQLQNPDHIPQLASKLKYIENAPLDNENIQAALMTGKIFTRGIGNPSSISRKHQTVESAGEILMYEETLARLELRKVLRTEDQETTTSKEIKTGKVGNPNRSVAMLAPGAAVYAPAGFLIINPVMDNIKNISIRDDDSGAGEKRTFTSYKS